MWDLISWTGWTEEDWKDSIEMFLGAVGIVASFCLFFVYL